MSFAPWMLTAGANAVMVVVYGLVAVSMLRAIIDGRQLRSNPLLTATAAIFVACTLGHGSHLAHALLASATVGGDAVRTEFGDMRLLVWDVITALVAVYFYTLRSRFAIVYRGAALCEDMEKREHQALEMHDNIVQGLAQAKMALDLGQREEAYQAIESTLAASRRIMTEVLGNEGDILALGPGDIRRAGGAA